MNLMRKLRGSAGSCPAESSESTSASSTHTHLGLMHLKKLFSEYTNPSQPLSDIEKEDKLYNMLPLFCKVFDTNNTNDMSEKFWDILGFCQQVSNLMVNEIAKRASNRSTQVASCAIVSFLEIVNSEESSNGWMLLSTLNLLAAGDQALIQVMTTASIPSTLVKCLYLFFDLPDLPEGEADIHNDDSEFTPRERRTLLQKIFVQILVRLCSHKVPCEELARKDSLSLLFSSITSWCAPHNVMWRKSAAEVLVTLSRHGLSSAVVQYIHRKGCISMCVENMQRIPELTPLEVVEMFVAVFCVLKDSSDVSQLLLDDFRTCQGYVFLSEFLLKHDKPQIPDLLTDGLEEERMGGNEGRAALRNLVLMISALCSAGYGELRPARDLAQLYKMQGFVMPQPTNQGGAVRNVQAFQVLQSVFIKSSSPALCCTILDAISSVYHADNANYFILESQNTLSQFSERIHIKNREIQEKFFELVEFVVFQLNFVPCKELVSLSLLLKSNASKSCSILCMRTLLNLLKYNSIFKDVYREVGMLEVFVTCLSRYAVYLKDRQLIEEDKMKPIGPAVKNDSDAPKVPERKKRISKLDVLLKDEQSESEEMELGSLVMEGLTSLLNGNASNCNLFRECGGAKCVHGMVAYELCRSQALGVIRELIVSGSGEEDMAALLNGMHSTPSDEYQLKLDILNSLLACLRESHRTRTIFRKVSGFVYVTSVLVSLEGKLKGERQADKDLLHLIHTVFYTITTAMRFEPANAKFFHQEICMTTLCDTIRLLGCFNEDTVLKKDIDKCDPKLVGIYYDVFTQDILNLRYPDNVPYVYVHAVLIFRLLYNIALDAFDKPISCFILNNKTGLSRQNSAVGDSELGPWMVHPGPVCAMVRLLCGVIGTGSHASAVCTIGAEVIRSCSRSERNQQVACAGGLCATLLPPAISALQSDSHPLHTSLQYILERLAAHHIEPHHLREFLRMGNPLNCQAPELGQICKPGGPVPLTRIKTLVSMTTPKDYRSHGACTQPPFVEFDMSAEGFGCLYLPSIAPQSVNLNALGVQDGNISGGIGTGDRVFPPQTGLTFSVWLCVDKYSDPRSDPHCVRLLTLVRSLNSARSEHIVCLALVLSARDKAIVVSTQETLVPHNVGDWEPEGTGECGARVWCPDLQQEGVWRHLVLVLNRAVLKNSTFSLYLDGVHMHSGKLQYVSCNAGGGAATLPAATSAYAILGTPPPWRRYSSLVWRLGPTLFIDEVLSAQTISTMYNLGPHYVGTLQAPPSPSNPIDCLTPLVSEEKVTFGLNARSMSLLTLAKIRKLYSRNDTKSIAKQLGMSSHENATPIRVLHNSAGHLCGPARCLGGVVVGYLGVRVFCPKPASIMIDTVGGCSVLLGLIAMAQDVECLYAGVKALVCIVRANKSAQAEMDRRKGYQTLAMLLKKKRPLLNSHILHLIFGLVGTVDSQKETSSIPNLIAFQDLICELDVWIGAPGGLIKSLLEHLLELATEATHKAHNLRTMRELHLVPKLLYSIGEIKVSGTRTVLLQLLSALLGLQPRPSDLLCLGQFMISTIPLPNQPEKDTLVLKETDIEDSEREPIVLRNRCFQMLFDLLFNSRGGINGIVCEEITRILGHDWLLVFMMEHIHYTSGLWALRIFTAMCACNSGQSQILQRIREGTGAGGWLRGVSSPPHQTLLHASPFAYMHWLGPSMWCAERYYLYLSTCVGSVGGAVRDATSVSLSHWRGALLGGTAVSDALVSLLKLLRRLLHGPPDDRNKDYPIGIMEIIFHLYNNVTDFPAIMMNVEVLNALASVLFPPCREESQTILESGSESGPSSPTEEEEWSATPTQACDMSLLVHPVRESIMKLICTVVMHSIPLSPTRQPPVIDMVLDASPPESAHRQQVEYQTEVLSTLMEHLLTADVFTSESNLSNVCYLIARLVDKLWQGQLSRDPHDVFDFIVKLLTMAKKKSTCMSLENLHHCLNRNILFLLSRPSENIADQMAVLEALHKLTNHRLLIFGAGNHDLEFIGCLTYCLLQLSSNMKITLDTHMKTTWHVNPSNDLESQDAKLHEHQGHKLTVIAAKRVWEEVYACRKPAVEEALRVTLTTPKLDRDTLAGPSARLWLTYLDNETKAPYRVPWEIHNQIQSKIQKVTGGLTRLASRTKVKKEDSNKSKPSLSRAQTVQYMLDHIQLAKSWWSRGRAGACAQFAHTSRYVEAEWRTAWAELVRERGLWGRADPWPLSKWKLDCTEGPARMRRKLHPNALFYLHYPFRSPEKQLKYKVAQSFDSEEYYKTYQQWRGPGSNLSELDLLDPEQAQPFLDANKKELSLDTPNIIEGSPTDLVSSGVVSRGRTQSSNEGNEDGAENEEDDETPEEKTPAIPDNQTLLRLLEPNERIFHMFRCARIQGLDTTEGLILFGREHCYVVDGFTVLKNREIKDLESCPDDYEPILPTQAVQRSNERQCSKFLYEDIREVHKRRYLLQPIALEVFFSDGRNYLLAFPRKTRNKVVQRLTASATGLADSAAGSVAGQKRGVAVEQSAGLLATLIGDTSVTHRWLRGEISNFQYLMYLNTLAGRSYNDLMQYPIFPWILADYDSQELDLTNPATFRDLSKPMGAQSNDRLEQFRKRYKEWDDPHGETPPYHYGTHYSSAMIVCSYLVRMEPFTQHFLRLQGGHFDLADRMFHSIKEGWNSASRHNMADVKELIPEFFYLPEFLMNSNNFDLGCKQSGERLGDIVLPPWSKGDPHEFIRAHRAALECDYVSARLHHWIDLIFGYKQRGPPALAADNVFHHLFYEGNVDIYNIDDPLKKNATIGFINNFGQIPKQLFKKPHPNKKMSQRSSTILDPNNIIQSPSATPPEKLFFHNIENLRPSLQPIKEVKGPVGQIIYTEKAVLAVEQNKILMPPSYIKYVAWGFADHSLRIGNYDNDKITFVSEAVAQACGEIVACACLNDKTIITAGTSTVVTIWQYCARARRVSVRASLCGHVSSVCCLAASAAQHVCVSGGRDTAIVWDTARATYLRMLPHNQPVVAVAVNDLTGDIATCSGSYLRVWSINGVELGCIDTMRNELSHSHTLLCAAFSLTRDWDPLSVIITGSTDGVVRMWSIEYIEDTNNMETEEKDKQADTSATEASIGENRVISSSIDTVQSSVDECDDVSKNKAAVQRVHELVKQMSLSHEEGNLNKSGSESSLSDVIETKESANIQDDKDLCSDSEELEPSMLDDNTLLKESSPSIDDSNGELGDAIDKLHKQDAVVYRHGSKGKSIYRKSGGSIGETDSMEGESIEVEARMRSSKSDTSLSDSFVVVPHVTKQDSPSKEMKWRRVLISRGRLTMHTAFERKDNTAPAAITSLAPALSGRALAVGDSRGRVFRWSVPEGNKTGPADHWIRDDTATHCVRCQVKFSALERRHHCRSCGSVVCGKCSRYTAPVRRLRALTPVRVCKQCHHNITNSTDN